MTRQRRGKDRPPLMDVRVCVVEVPGGYVPKIVLSRDGRGISTIETRTGITFPTRAQAAYAAELTHAHIVHALLARADVSAPADA